MPTSDLEPIIKDGIAYVAMTPERIEALEKGLDAVHEWVYRDMRPSSPVHPMSKYVPALEQMIREAKGEPEPVENYEDYEEGDADAN